MTDNNKQPSERKEQDAPPKKVETTQHLQDFAIKRVEVANSSDNSKKNKK